MTAGAPAGWLTLKLAGQRVGLTDQAMRQWIKTEKLSPSEVCDLGEGRRPRYYLDPDALARAAAPASSGGLRIAHSTEPLVPSDPLLPNGWTTEDEVRALRQELQETRRSLDDVRRERDRLLLDISENRAIGLKMAEALVEKFSQHPPTAQ